ncbi:uncharacterized protein NPIL_366291 [Nephila pilipes]|uniref:Uncharacterized protein n=1 Tax=Nephila pilipes TaxID=299642 RepID=A0A8X6P8Z9_NEPPI|nr:uncharacterized protein NPIL_93061 [Nephila pilipes]GFT58135.1 uncharacterized protein NPIL_366291 [Nephila pilipes]
MNRPLHEHSTAFLRTLFPGVIQKLLLEQNGSKNVVHWETESVHKRDEWYNKQWSLPIRVTGWKFINCVIPLDRRYEPSEEHTPVYLSLHGGRNLHFKTGNAEQDVTWSFQCITDELFVLSRKQQNVMNQIKEMKMAQEALWKCKVVEGKAERDVLKTKEMELKMKRGALKTKEYELKIERNMLKTERDVIKWNVLVRQTEKSLEGSCSYDF